MAISSESPDRRSHHRRIQYPGAAGTHLAQTFLGGHKIPLLIANLRHQPLPAQQIARQRRLLPLRNLQVGPLGPALVQVRSRRSRSLCSGLSALSWVTTSI